MTYEELFNKPVSWSDRSVLFHGDLTIAQAMDQARGMVSVLDDEVAPEKFDRVLVRFGFYPDSPDFGDAGWYITDSQKHGAKDVWRYRFWN
jgi:hypothetical protein